MVVHQRQFSLWVSLLRGSPLQVVIVHGQLAWRSVRCVLNRPNLGVDGGNGGGGYFNCETGSGDIFFNSVGYSQRYTLVYTGRCGYCRCRYGYNWRALSCGCRSGHCSAWTSWRVFSVKIWLNWMQSTKNNNRTASLLCCVSVVEPWLHALEHFSDVLCFLLNLGAINFLG